MCTLSWWINADERGVLFNRDELRTRSRGLAPAVRSSVGGYEAICPTDPDAGGTWIGINEKGLIVALLNNYAAQIEDTRSIKTSRGNLVVDSLQQAASCSDVANRLTLKFCSEYRPFVLFSMGLKSEPAAFSWDGYRLTSINLSGGSNPRRMLTSSSQYETTCRTYRDQLFADDAFDRADIRKKHLHYHPEASALGPLMVRENAATDSITEIVVSKDRGQVWFQSVNRDYEWNSKSPQQAPTLSKPVLTKLPFTVGV